MTPRIQKAIDILLDAVNTNTLVKGNCAACAVGNLVAQANNGKIFLYQNIPLARDKDTYDIISPEWSDYFCTYEGSGEQHYKNGLFKEVFNQKAFNTDFTFGELAAIEYAFETNTKIRWSNYPAHSKDVIKQDQIKGLEAVVKVMLQFDDIQEDVKEVFTNKVLVTV